MPQYTLPISLTVITLNEVRHLERCLRSAPWATEWIVVDSGSTDGTVELAHRLGAKVIQQSWLGYGAQKNVAHRAATQPWVLNLDADESVSRELEAEILDWFGNPSAQSPKRDESSELVGVGGFLLPRRTRYLGKWVRHGGWYPDYQLRLARRELAEWTEPNVHERLVLKSGSVIKMKHPIDHDAFHSIDEQVWTNLRYSRAGSHDLLKKGQKPSIVLLLMKPIGKFVESYFWKRGFLDGLVGWMIAINAAHSMFLKYAYLFEDRIRKSSKGDQR